MEALYRGRLDITLKSCIVNAKLINFRQKVASKFPYQERLFTFSRYSSSAEPQEIAPSPFSHGVEKNLQNKQNKELNVRPDLAIDVRHEVVM